MTQAYGCALAWMKDLFFAKDNTTSPRGATFIVMFCVRVPEETLPTHKLTLVVH